MCLILLVWRRHEEFPCFLAANRDEFHARRSAPAGWWPEDARILAGRDLEGGGTWLGVTRSGRFAALTNYRDPARARAGAPSRGGIVTSLLQSAESVPDALQRLRRIGPEYNGFNVLFSDGGRLGTYESVTGEGRELGPGVYGLSNHLLDTPWPKVAVAKSRIMAAVDHDLTNALALLRDQRPADGDELPDTGVSVEWERLLSSAFIKAPQYGTRCSTILRIDAQARARFDEWTWNPDGAQTHRVSLALRITPQ